MTGLKIMGADIMGAGMIEIVGPAAAAGLMIALTHVPLGIEVLRRGIVFIDLAVAQLAGLGAVVAGMLAAEPLVWVTQALALGFAFLGAAFFREVERRLPALQEAIIGCAYVLAAAVALMALSGRPHGGEEIQQMLSGQILFVTWRQVTAYAPVYGAILALWFCLPGMRRGLWFYLLFSLAITSSVQLAGVFLVFASLIAPAVGTFRVKNARARLRAAYGIAIVAVTLGFAAAIITDLPAGPVLVCGFMLAALAGSVWLRKTPASRKSGA